MNEGLRIVDLVFARSSDRWRRGRLVAAIVVGIGLHLGAAAWAITSAPSLERWSAELATRVHAELTREEVVELPPPPPQVEKPKAAPPPVEKTPSTPPMPHPPRVHLSQPPPSPAQAGKIVAADPSAAVDLPGINFVTGTAKTYAGGTTASDGKSPIPVTGPVNPAGPPATPRPAAPEKDLSAQVTLENDEWSCAWPREADTESIDEQSVILQVVVGPDGKAESVKIVSDPGHGFGAAARGCALATRFSPARDKNGKPVRAPSPPLRLHFYR
jgi:protein TonB